MKHKLLPCIIGIAILISAVLQGQGGSRASSPLITNMKALATLRQDSDVLPYLAFDLITDIGAHIAKHREIKAQAPQVKILRYISANAWRSLFGSLALLRWLKIERGCLSNANERSSTTTCSVLRQRG